LKLTQVLTNANTVWVETLLLERESLTAPGAFAGTADARCDVAAPAITWAKLLKKCLENVTLTGQQL